jgi:protein-L-isoaspartate(D-aspartate) O-methyltransferase
MTDFVAARRIMVDSQVRTSDVTDLRIIAAMQALPRERFLPAGQADLAYLDFDVPVTAAPAGGAVRRLLKPMVLAKLLQAAEIAPGDHVLDVGCATGYSSALLAQLSGSVVGLEEDAGLAEQAGNNLRALGFAPVQVVRGPLADGWNALAPYDVIVLEGASEIAPKALLRQLKPGHAVLLGRRKKRRPADFRCGSTPAARLRRPGCLRILTHRLFRRGGVAGIRQRTGFSLGRLFGGFQADRKPSKVNASGWGRCAAGFGGPALAVDRGRC